MPRTFTPEQERRIAVSIKQGGTGEEMAKRADVSINAIRLRLKRPTATAIVKHHHPTNGNNGNNVNALPPKQYRRIAKFILKHNNVADIAKKVECALSTVQRCAAYTRGSGMAAQGFVQEWAKLTSNGTRPHISTPTPTNNVNVVSDGRGVTWTPENLRILAKLLNRGHTYKSIAAQFGSTYQAVYQRAKQLNVKSKSSGGDSNGNANAATANDREGAYERHIIYAFARCEQWIRDYADSLEARAEDVRPLPRQLAHRVGELLLRSSRG